MAKLAFLFFVTLLSSALSFLTKDDHLRHCEFGHECQNRECCLENKTSGLGECQPMGDVAWYCYAKQSYAWSRPENMVSDFDLCPCQTGYFCGPISKTHPVYGQMGICTFG